ncbi:MAG TPA: GtrA family protein [Candidatus Paceibacterota bacterium]|nr:GtrA family protein [Candidatus Paceibacterota bacterium]
MDILRLIRRGIKYSAGGISTFGLDLLLVYILTHYTPIPVSGALILGFLCGISINYLISYFWVFRGTTQTLARGYVYFLSIGICAGIAISYSTLFITQHTSLSILESRVCVASVIGIGNFLSNALINFKMT